MPPPLRGPKQLQPKQSNTVKICIEPARDNENLECSEDTKRTFIRALKPRDMHIRIDRITKTRNKGILVEVPQGKETDLTSKPELKRMGLTAKLQSKLNPRIAIYNVSTSYTKDDVKQMLITQNLTEIVDMDEAEIMPVFKFGKRERPTVHWVVEVSPRIRTHLIQATRAYLDFTCHPVKDYVRLTRCFHCQDFDHLAKDCRNEVRCSNCSRAHPTEECPQNENDDAQCTNCRRAHLTAVKHTAASNKCPTYVRRLNALINSINYDG